MTSTELTPKSITVAALDDNADFLDNGLLILEQEGFNLNRFTDPEQFTAYVSNHQGVLVAIVDHDLGREFNGYDVVRRVRSARPDGLLLPVIYLTGRESETGYLANEAADPFSAPSIFLSKRNLARVDLDTVVLRLAEQGLQALRVADHEAIARATASLAALPDDQLRSF